MQHEEGGREEWGEYSPRGISPKFAMKKVDKIENSVEQLTGKVDNILKTLSPLQTDNILQKLFSPPTSKNGCGKMLKTVQSPNGYYIGQSLNNLRSPLKPIGQTSSCPWWLRSMFAKANQIGLTGDDIAIAAYIFGRSGGDILDPKEVLIRAHEGFENATRKNLLGMLPGAMMDEEVLIMVACMLTEQEMSNKKFPEVWFMPTNFSQFVDKHTLTTEKIIELYGHRFMGPLDSLKKIYIPINQDNMHWFVMVVDFHEKQIILLDSLPSLEHVRARIRKVRKVTNFLEDLLEEPFFGGLHDQPTLAISDFDVVEPEGLVIQKPYSNDCGVFVASWMIAYDKPSYAIDVDDCTRLKIALDIVTKSHNEIREEVKTRSYDHFK